MLINGFEQYKSSVDVDFFRASFPNPFGQMYARNFRGATLLHMTDVAPQDNGLQPGMAMQLLGFVCSASYRFVSRYHHLELFWPDEDELHATLQRFVRKHDAPSPYRG
jgi:hypothetical protein